MISRTLCRRSATASKCIITSPEGNGFMPDANGPPRPKLSMTQPINPSADPFMPWPDLFPEHVSHPAVWQPSDDRDFVLEPKPTDGPPGTIRLRVRDTRPRPARCPTSTSSGLTRGRITWHAGRNECIRVDQTRRRSPTSTPRSSNRWPGRRAATGTPRGSYGRRRISRANRSGDSSSTSRHRSRTSCSSRSSCDPTMGRHRCSLLRGPPNGRPSSEAKQTRMDSDRLRRPAGLNLPADR